MYDSGKICNSWKCSMDKNWILPFLVQLRRSSGSECGFSRMLRFCLLSSIDIWMLSLKIKQDPFRNNYSFFCIQDIIFTKSIAFFEEEAKHWLCFPQVIYPYEDGLSLVTLAAESGRWWARQAKQWGIFRWCDRKAAVQVRKDRLLRKDGWLPEHWHGWPHCTPLQVDPCPAQP